MSHFAKVARVPGDPILGLLDAYRNDPRADKLDLGVGVYKDAQGLTPILRSVKLAEQRLVEQETTKSYVGGHGDALFAARLAELVLGAASPLLLEQRADATQTPGGTGALRLAGDFITHCLPGRGIWLSDPTWPIHETLFAAAGLKVSHYPYVSADNRLDVEAMLAGLERIPQGDVVLLHACCHNPTGFDLSHDDWRRVLDVVRRRELLPLIDFAYQGFGDGLDEDAWAVRLFAGELPEVLVNWLLLEELRPVPRPRRRTDRLRAERREAHRRAQPTGLPRPQPVVDPAGAWRRGGRGDPRRQRARRDSGRKRSKACVRASPACASAWSRPWRRTAWPSASPTSARNAGCSPIPA